MARQRSKSRKKRIGQDVEYDNEDHKLTGYTPIRKRIPLEAKTESQGHYILSIQRDRLTFGVGPAGTGKTYVCGAMAAEALDTKKIEKLVLTRPVKEAGENLGSLPGELSDKFAPYLQPFRDVLDERLGKTYVDYLLRVGRIEGAPLAYMRGRTFKNCYVILDEAQNTTPVQMKMFLTRIGEGCTVIVNGDLTQKDIPGQSGLADAVRRLESIRGVSIVEFDKSDVVRSGLVQDIVEAYEAV